ncbi:MAG: transposase [Treponema sp.]|nr:transposase [Treponema sp.]
MSYLFDQEIQGKKYVYLIRGYRDNGKVKQQRKCVGKVDPVTGKRIFNPDCIDLLKESGIEFSEEELKLFSIDDIRKSKTQNAGIFHLLKNIATNNHLIGSLKSAFPENWQDIFSLACYMIATNDPMMYYASWVEDNVTYPVTAVSSQRISELLGKMNEEDINRFFKSWHEHYQRVHDYLALDITSISSYSSINDQIEWGHNRDGEKLPQVNLCMLMAEKSRIPLFQTTYSGSLSDIRTLKTTLSRFEAITGNRDVTVIMDKGFGSLENLKEMLDFKHNGKNPVKFLASFPFTSNFIKSLVDNERDSIDTISNAIILNGDSLRATTKVIPVEGSSICVHAHIYYNPIAAAQAKERLYSEILSKLALAKENPEKYENNSEYNKYIDFLHIGGQYKITLDEKAIQESIAYSGWLVMLSNRFTDAENALQIYRDKDVVEKGFLRLKNSIDLGRLRIHGRKSMNAKLFVGFVASILMCEINKVMVCEKLYSKYTMTELLKTVGKQRKQTINGKEIMYPTTKAQQDIYDAFKISSPE